MPFSTIIIVLLILVLLGTLPQTGWHQFGWGPSGLIGTVVLIILILALLGRI